MKHKNKKTRRQEYKQHIQNNNNTVKSYLQVIQIIQLSMLPLSSIFVKFKHHTEFTKVNSVNQKVQRKYQSVETQFQPEFPQTINSFKTSVLGSHAVQFDNQYLQFVDTSCLHLQERGRHREYVPLNLRCLSTNYKESTEPQISSNT